MITKNEVNQMLLNGDLNTKKKRKVSVRFTTKPSFEQLFNEYVVEAKTSTELAEKYNVSPSTVRAWYSRMKRERLQELKEVGA